MKRIYNNMCKKLVAAVVVILSALMSSCTDYLTIIPPNIIVHENFWQTKDDVNGMLATSYLKLASTDAVRNAIVWGESRADNLKNAATNGDLDFEYIIKANILEDNSYSNWAIYYEAINYANLVIEYAPLVVDRDPDFSAGDLNVVLGEMYAMRALCHFYLVRTFRDIPMALVPAVNDAELPDYKQVHPLEALNYIMADLDKAENLVMPSGNYANPMHNYGRFTKNAVLAIKADVNLWRAAFTEYYLQNPNPENPYPVAQADVATYYNQCIDNCNAVLDNMEAQYVKEHPNSATQNNYPYRLILNEGDVKQIRNSKVSTAYNSIFGDMNSSESIFELQVEGDNITNGNYLGISSVYGTNGNASKAVVPNNFVEKYEKDDLRRYSFMKVPLVSSDAIKDVVTVAKYTAAASPQKEYRSGDRFDANWIVYRKTDVMLMKAEALAAKPTPSEKDFKDAFQLVKVINTRSRIDTTYSKMYNPLREAQYMSKENCLKLVLDERGRELAFEGKRWYDLVRKALRENTTSGITFVAEKLDNNVGTVKSKMSTIDGLFFPIYIEELRFNKNLKQNPAYDKEDSSIEIN